MALMIPRLEEKVVRFWHAEVLMWHCQPKLARIGPSGFVPSLDDKTQSILPFQNEYRNRTSLHVPAISQYYKNIHFKQLLILIASNNG